MIYTLCDNVIGHICLWVKCMCLHFCLIFSLSHLIDLMLGSCSSLCFCVINSSALNVYMWIVFVSKDVFSIFTFMRGTLFLHERRTRDHSHYKIGNYIKTNLSFSFCALLHSFFLKHAEKANNYFWS